MSLRCTFRSLFCLILIIPLALASLPVLQAKASPTYTFNVNTTAETDDASPGNNVCADASGHCSLTAAVQEANALNTADVINLQANTYHLTAQLDIQYDLTINGISRTTTIIDGSGPSGAVGFYVNGHASVTFGNLTLTNFSKAIKTTTGGVNASIYINDSNLRDNSNTANGGSAIDNQCPDCAFTISNSNVYNNSSGSCGAVLSKGTINFNNSTIHDNTATSGNGGAICNDSGYLYLTSTLVYLNHAGNDSSDSGGAIYQYASDSGYGETGMLLTKLYGNSAGRGGGIYSIFGSVTVDTSEIFGNDALGNGGGLYIDATATSELVTSNVYDNSAVDGGGLYLTTQQGSATWHTMTLENSTIISNTASGNGGGVYFDEGNYKVTNSTISGNTANDHGGGVYGNKTTSVLFSNVTITHNTADFADTGDGKGGGFYQAMDSDLEFNNSIIAGNLDIAAFAEIYTPDCYGSLNNRGYNLVGLATAVCSLSSTVGMQYNSFEPALDPRLGPLTFYSEYAYYHPLLLGPAVDRGDPSGCKVYTTPLEQDQLSNFRPFGSAGGGYTPRCDLGAIEASTRYFGMFLAMLRK